MTNAIETRHLRKAYGTELVLDELSWSVPVGEACALLGANGAGKSTTLRILMGFTQPSGGAALVHGADPWAPAPAVKARVAYVPENPILPGWMRVDALIDVHRGLYPRWDARLEAELRSLLEVGGRERVAELSKGQHRRLHLLLALSQGADLLLLDEPGSGLDVAGRRQLLSLLGQFLVEEGRTVVFSTHIVTDVERIASRVAILDRGRLVTDAPLEELQEDVKTVHLSRSAWERLAPQLEHAGLLARDVGEREAVLVVRHFASVADALLRRGLGEGEVLVSQTSAADVYVARDGEEARVVHMSLEDTFLALTSPAVGARA